jgi:hypothetical protein
MRFTPGERTPGTHWTEKFLAGAGHLSSPQHVDTERRCRVVNAPASYAGGPVFETWSGDLLSWWFYSVPLGKRWVST